MENNTDEFCSFAFSENLDSTQHHYRITAREDRYAVECDGMLIAELVNDGHWRQADGERLSEELIERMGDRIEAYYC